MSNLDILYRFIERMRDLNVIDNQVILEDHSRYPRHFYKKVSDIFKSIKELDLGYPDLFFSQLSCELSREGYGLSIDLLKKEIESFVSWYFPNKSVIDELFSFDALSDVINEDANAKFGFKLHGAQLEFEKAKEDEDIAHNLARAYGSRAYGGRTDKDFDQSDWNYIQSSLDAFRDHFQCDHVNLPKMYEDYPSVFKRKKEETLHAISDLRKQMDEYRYSLLEVYVEDAYQLIYDYLSTLFPFIGLGQNEDKKTESPQIIRPKGGKRAYGKYNSLDECIPDPTAFSTITALVKEYYDSYGKMDYIFARRLLDYLKNKNLIHQNNCSIAHFGELLISYFPQMFTFETGGALSDASGLKDPGIDEFIRKRFTKKGTEEES